jgi:L-threonylcarbamoyladenylate synthase
MNESSACVDIERALRHLQADGLVAFPTETVWGLAACARSHTALECLRTWKGRSDSQPISILVPGADALRDLGVTVPPLAAKLMERFWPGPLTLVLQCDTAVALAPGIARDDGAVGFRCSPHPRANRLALEAARRGLGPLTATSFNRTGCEPVATLSEARQLAESPGRQPVLVLEIEAEDASGEAPSTVVDLSRADPEVLRRGAISEFELESAGWGVGHHRR